MPLILRKHTFAALLSHAAARLRTK